jgi:hypothetical protein
MISSTRAPVRSFHDFTLERIIFEWTSAEVTFDLRGPEGLEKITARGVRNLVVPRRDSWGPSVSILELASTEDRDDLVLISVQMQSGDRIEVLCEGID